MTDFIADLETELVAAARRRARRRVPRPRLVPAVAAVAIVVAVLTVLRGLDGSRTADEQPVTPPAGSGVVVTLPAAEPVRDDAGCRGGVDAALALQPQFAVFDRPQTAHDRALPGGFGALPADFVDEESLRQAGGRENPLRLIRVGGLSGPCRGAEARPVDGGVCLIAGVEHAATRCFPDEAIVRGTALAAIPPRFVPTDWVYGIAPNGVDSVRLSWSGGTVTAPVIDNGYAAQLAGVKAGVEVRVELVSAVRCEPSQAAGALIDGDHGEPPRALERAMADLGARGAWRAHARVVKVRDGVEVWVVPDMPCDRGGGHDERVCLLPTGGSLLCGEPRSVQRRGMSIQFGQGALTSVAGMSPSGARYADVRIRDVVHPIPVKRGVFGAMIVDRFGDPAHVTYR